MTGDNYLKAFALLLLAFLLLGAWNLRSFNQVQKHLSQCEKEKDDLQKSFESKKEDFAHIKIGVRGCVVIIFLFVSTIVFYLKNRELVSRIKAMARGDTISKEATQKEGNHNERKVQTQMDKVQNLERELKRVSEERIKEVNSLREEKEKMSQLHKEDVEKISKLERALRLRREEIILSLGQCVVCQERPLETLMRPCRHVCSCRACAGLLVKCPICRGDIEAKMDVFVSL